MNQQRILNQLEEIVELPAGTLSGSEALADLENWDSLAMVNLIALANGEYGLTLSPRQIAPCVTVADLVKLFSKAE